MKCPNCDEDMTGAEAAWTCSACSYRWPASTWSAVSTATSTSNPHHGSSFDSFIEEEGQRKTVMVGQVWRRNDPRFEPEDAFVRVAAVSGDEVIVANRRTGRHSRIKQSTFGQKGQKGLTFVSARPAEEGKKT